MNRGLLIGIIIALGGIIVGALPIILMPFFGSAYILLGWFLYITIPIGLIIFFSGLAIVFGWAMKKSSPLKTGLICISIGIAFINIPLVLEITTNTTSHFTLRMGNSLIFIGKVLIIVYGILKIYNWCKGSKKQQSNELSEDTNDIPSSEKKSEQDRE